MNRLGLLHPSTLTGKHNAEKTALYTAFLTHTQNHLHADRITYALPSTGALIGPFGILLHTPPVGRAFLDLSEAINALPGLSPRLTSIISLVVASYERAPFQTYANSRLCAIAGLTQNEISSLQAGLFANTFGEEDRAAYSVARELCVGSGALSERVWEEAKSELGKEGAIKTVMIVAVERLVCSLLRGFESMVPVRGERVEG